MIKLSKRLNLLNTKPIQPKVPHHKNTIHQKTIHMKIPSHVKIRMDQHIGTPCSPVVKEGDNVKVGQVIAESNALVSTPIHASVSGIVEKIEAVTLENGQSVTEIIINADGFQTLDESLKPPMIKNQADFFQAVKNSGLVGLGGAAFPTHVKLDVSSKEERHLDILLINGAECEPYITSDAREFLETPYDLLAGIQVVSHYLKIKKVIIGIEDHNQEVIKSLSDVLSKAREAYPQISIKQLPSTYPQGAEKVLIQTCTGRIVPLGKLPPDVGVQVLNVSTIASLARYLKTGIPLTLRRVTVDGSAIRNPGNIWVPIGTITRDIITFCGGYQEKPYLLLHGGPMMGVAQENDEAPITKRTNAILAFGKSEMKEHEEIACIRCARCIDACPVNLMPVSIDQNVRIKNLDALHTLDLNACINCGLCSFVCPSNRTLVQHIRIGKDMLRDSTEGGKTS